jgi:hypothetical protein
MPLTEQMRAATREIHSVSDKYEHLVTVVVKDPRLNVCMLWRLWF